MINAIYQKFIDFLQAEIPILNEINHVCIPESSVVDFLAFAAVINFSTVYFDNAQRFLKSINENLFGINLNLLDRKVLNSLNKISDILVTLACWPFKCASLGFAIFCGFAIFFSGLDEIKNLGWKFIFFLAPIIVFTFFLLFVVVIKTLFAWSYTLLLHYPKVLFISLVSTFKSTGKQWTLNIFKKKWKESFARYKNILTDINQQQMSLAKILQENIDTIMTTPGRETKKRSSHRRRKNIFSILFRGRPIGKLSFSK